MSNDDEFEGLSDVILQQLSDIGIEFDNTEKNENTAKMINKISKKLKQKKAKK